MKRGAKYIGLAVAAAVGLFVAVGAWVLGTESGLRAAWRAGARFMPAAIEVGAIDGKLVGPLVLTNVRYSTPDLQASIERIELEWAPRALLRRVLSVERLVAAGVDVVRVPRDEEPPAGDPWQPPEEVRLPVRVDVVLAAVEDVRVRTAPDAAEIVVDDVHFGLRFDDDGLAIDGLDVRAPLFDVAGQARIAPAAPYAAELALDAVVRPPQRPAATAAVRASGTLDRLELRIDAEAPYTLAVELDVADVLDGPVLDGEVRARVVPADIGVDIAIAEAGLELELAGPLDDLAVGGRADAAIPDLMHVDIALAARWLGNAVEVATLDIDERDGPAALGLAGRIALDPGPDIALTGEWSGLRWPLAGEPVAASPGGTLELRGTPTDLEARLAAAWDTDGRIDGVVRRDSERIAADLEWRDVSWPPTEPRLESARGALQVGGTLDDYTLVLDAELAAAADVAEGWQADGAAGHVRAQGRGDRRRFELASVDVAVLDGELRGSGAVAWDPAFDGAIAVEFAQLDPGLLVPEWAGRIGGAIEATARSDDAGLTADVARLDVAGTLRGRPIDLDARGRYSAPDRGTIDVLTLRSGASSLAANGSLGESLDVEWRVDSPNLEDFWPGLAGRLTTAGRARGPLRRPLVDAEASGEALALNGIEVGQLELSADLDVAGAAASQVAVDIRDARVADRSIERLELRGDGTASDHRVAADVSIDGIEAALALRGAFEKPWEPGFVWRFAIDDGRVSHPALPAWTLDAPGSGTLTADGAELERSCMRSGEASLCIAAARRNGTTDVSLDLATLPFEHFAAYLPEDTRVTGSVSGNGRIELSPELAPRASLTLTTTPARIAANRSGTTVPPLAFAAGRAVLELDGGRLDTELDLPLARGEGGIDARAAVVMQEGEPLAASSVDGRLRAEFANLAFLSDLVRGVDATSGALSMDVALSGSVGAPSFAGDIVLRDGSVRLREPGIVVEALDVVVAGDGSGAITIDASAESGGGTLEADGVLRFAESLAIGNLALRGDTFELANTPDARIWVSPDLTLELTPERIQLGGTVQIPRARFTPRDSVEGAVSVSADQIIVDEEEARTAQLSRPFYARVAIALGDDVTFDGFGLTGKLRGALEVVEVPAEPVTGSGELRVESGTYEAYGQELEVRTGRLLFAGGAVSRPGLDIEAVRRPTEDILVGARVRGTLDRPELSVFSEPPMQRSEQLSYLLLGRPLETASGSETSALSQAAMALGLRGGNFVSDRLNQALGFDEFGIQSQPAQANSASFVIGKYLTPSLYVSYGVGLFEPVNTLRLRYTISRRWRLVTESSTAASGGDLIYHIERGD